MLLFCLTQRFAEYSSCSAVCSSDRLTSAKRWPKHSTSHAWFSLALEDLNLALLAMHLARGRPQLQGTSHWLLLQHSLPNELAERWSMAAAGCTGGARGLLSDGTAMTSSLHPGTQKCPLLTTRCNAFSVATLGGFAALLWSSWTAALPPPFPFPSFSLALFSVHWLSSSRQNKRCYISLDFQGSPQVKLCGILRTEHLSVLFIQTSSINLCISVWISLDQTGRNAKSPPSCSVLLPSSVARRCCLVMFKSQCGM